MALKDSLSLESMLMWCYCAGIIIVKYDSEMFVVFDAQLNFSAKIKITNGYLNHVLSSTSTVFAVLLTFSLEFKFFLQFFFAK